MHPNGMFDWTDREAMLAFLGETAFATIFIMNSAHKAHVVHAPVLVTAPDRLRFHISRRNVAARAEGSRALVSCLGTHAYISPDWYGSQDQVPTWNYLVVECEGVLRHLDEEELVALLDDLSSIQEAALAPKKPWTRDKMDPRKFNAMVKAVEGYELRVEELRGSRKLGQNKSRSEVEGACEALRVLGRIDMAQLMGRAKA